MSATHASMPQSGSPEHVDTLVMANGKLYRAVTRSEIQSTAAVRAYDHANPSDAASAWVLPQPRNGAFEVNEGDRFLPLGGTSTIFGLAGIVYREWWHRFSNYQNILFFTGKSHTSSWWNPVNTVSALSDEELNSVVTVNFCSGVLIGRGVVLTARHCITGMGRTVFEDQSYSMRGVWCTRGNSLPGAKCAATVGAAFIWIEPNAFGRDTWHWDKDWAVVFLSESSQDVSNGMGGSAVLSFPFSTGNVMTLSQFSNYESPRFDPEFLASPGLAKSLNTCAETGSWGNCGNYDDPTVASSNSRGRRLLKRASPGMSVHRQFERMVEYDVMFGSGDSGGPFYWDGQIPGGTRFVTTVMSGGYYDITHGVPTAAGPRVPFWRDEIITGMEAGP